MGLSFFLPRTETVLIELEEYRKSVLEPRVLFLSVVFFLFSIHWGAEMVSYALFLKENLGLDKIQIGWYTALGFVMVGLGAYAGYYVMHRGWVTDLITLLIVGFALSGVFHILMCVPNVAWSFSFRLAHEVGDGLVSLVFYHGISRTFHVDRIGGCAAFISLWTAIGSCGGAILFGYVNDLAGPAWPLMISGAIAAVLAVVLKVKRWESTI
jgi:MFS family permease